MNKIGSIEKLLLFLLAASICVWILWFVNWMVSDMEKEETVKMQLWAKATTLIAQDSYDESEVIDLLLSIVQGNTTIPVVVTDAADEIISFRNVAVSDSSASSPQLAGLLRVLKATGQRIDIPIANDEMQHLYYGRSNTVTRLSYFPVLEIALVAFLIILAYIVFRHIKQMEQDKVWIGLARETAHQLGTPITAITGWADLLQSGDIDAPTASREILNDAERLKSVAERFSQIGSDAELSSLPLADTLCLSFAYLKPRISKRVSLSFDVDKIRGRSVVHNPILIGWAIENLCRNAIDAIDGDGCVAVCAFMQGDHAVIDVKDTGKGMSWATARKIFDAGFTTKQRGWGIGLALTHRIIKEYHKGKIFVLETEVGKGTTIRIVL